MNNATQNQYVWQRQLGSSNDTGDKEKAYGDIARSDLIDLVNKQRPPKISLDIGCNCGGTSAYVKKLFPDCKTYGIEMNKQAAKIAAEQVDCVLIGKFEDLHETGELEKNGILPNSIDLIICADVLEHMYDPWNVLVILKKYLSRDGVLLISIPNIRHLSTFADLSDGYFRYHDIGILDITHIRFFTLREFKKVLQETGYSFDKDIHYAFDQYLLTNFYYKYHEQLPCDIKVNSKLTLNNVTESELLEFCSTQFYIKARNWESFPLSEKDYCKQPQIPLFAFENNYICNENQAFLNQRDFYQEQTYNITNAAEISAYKNNVEKIKNKAEVNQEILKNKYLCNIFIFFTGETQNILSNTLNSLANQLETIYENSFRIVLFGDQTANNVVGFPLSLQSVIIANKVENCSLFYIKEALEAFEKNNETALFSIILDAGDIVLPQTMALLSKFSVSNNEIPALIYSDEAILDNRNNFADKLILKPEFNLHYFLESPTFLGKNIIWNNASLKNINYFEDNNFSTSILKLFLENKNKNNKNNKNNIYHLPEVLFKNNQQQTLERYENLYAAIKKFVKENNNSLITNAFLSNGKIENTFKLAYKLKNNANTDKQNVTWITQAPKDFKTCKNLLEKSFANLQQNNFNVNLKLVIFVNKQIINADALNYLQEKFAEYLQNLQNLQNLQKNSQNLLVLILDDNENYWSAVDDFIKDKNNNFAFAADENILLLDSYCNFKNANQLSELVGLLQQQNIGIISPLIVDSNEKIIGNAMILACQGIASGFANGITLNNKFNEAEALNINERINTMQSPLAMTLMAQIFKRNDYLKVNGFDTKNLQTETAIAIDFCLKFKTIFADEVNHIWNPNIELKASQNNYISCLTENETNYLLNNYLMLISNDNFYNFNYSRKLPFQPRSKEQNLISRIKLPHLEISESIAINAEKNNINLVEKCLPTLLSLPVEISSGTSYIRVIEPTISAIAMNKINAKILSAEDVNFVDYDVLFDSIKNKVDAVFLQRQLFFAEAFLLKQIKQYTKAKIIHDADDLITHIPEHNKYKINKSEFELQTALQNTLQYCDLFTVATPELANFYDKFHNNIKVIPNRLDKNQWYNLNPKQQPVERKNNKLRVGFFGNYGHTADVQIIIPLVKELANQIDFIFFGYCPNEVKPFLAEYHNFVATKNYPQKLASLDLDLVLAPIETDLFNTCKSNLKILQSGILGYPVIATNYGAYTDSPGNSFGLPICRVKNTLKAWRTAILDHINNPEITFQKGLELRQSVINYGFLQDHINDYLDAWFA